jgi:MHS family citrate/tricarballylate:H+ symporter-like MFS transporter
VGAGVIPNMSAPSDCASAPPRASIPALHVAAIVVGNGLDFYDFLSYTSFAVYIGKVFFPAHDPSISLIFSLLAFGAGFVTRPIGGIVLGSLGDRVGRKPAMVLSFLLMGAGMLGVALTPGYAQIGLLAPILLVGFRLIQGFALGGEVGPNTAYLIEAAPAARRGFYGSMQYATQNAAILLASSIGLLLSALLSAHDLETWGWRLAFLLGVVIIPFGIIIRRRLPETLHAADDAALAPDATKGTLRAAQRIRPYAGLIALTFVLLGCMTIGAYVIAYMTSFALNTLHLSAGIAFGVTIVTSLTGILCDFGGGLISDRFGRKPLMVLSGAMLLVLVIPVFWTITHFHSVPLLYALMGSLSMLFELCSVPIIVSFTESLPKQVRAGTVATVYAFAISIFGGATQPFITWLIKATGMPIAVGYFWAGALVLFMLAAVRMPESAPVKMQRC